MNRKSSVRVILLHALVLGLSALAWAAPAAAAIEESATFSSDRLTVRNLIGQVRVEAHGGSGFEVDVRIEGSDARPGLVRLDAGEDELNIRFPDTERDFVYPALGSGSNVTFRDEGGGSWLSDLIGEITGSGRIKVRGAGKGQQIWADVTVRVPRGGELEVQNAVGKIVARDVDGELELSTRSGDVEIENTRGAVAVATGSGNVDVTGVTGERIEIATGSGEVKAENCDGERIQVATGSGNIEVDGLRARDAQLATGSGDVEARGVELTNLDIGTGSGDVELELDRIESGDYDVGTGSGDITVTIPPGAGIELHAETDRGEIEVGLAGAEYSLKESDEVRLTVGGGGGRIDLGSGVGDIEIR